MNFRRKQAFTLIELLVVISIISLLVAILLPALASARTAAQGSMSLSNLRQLQISLHSYANDSKGYLIPHEFKPTDGAYRAKMWSGRLLTRGYVSTYKIFWSPARDTSWLPLHPSQNDNSSTDGVYVWERNTGYGANGYGAMPSEEMLESNQFRLVNLGHGDVPDPTKFMTMVENFRPDSYTAEGKDGYFLARCGRTGDESTWSFFSYNGGVARAYLDAHANIKPAEDMQWRVISQRTGQWTSNTRSKTAPWWGSGSDKNYWW